MHRSVPYLARFRDLLSLRFPRKADPTKISVDEKTTTEAEIDEELEQKKEMDALKARGVLKYLHSYEPPADLENQLTTIVRDVISASKQRVDDNSLSDLSFEDNGGNDLKFQILSAAEKAFGKTIPCSQLHELKTVNDLLEFYRSPVKNIGNYVEMTRSKDRLPQNMHFAEEAKRFHPLTDGESAFPGRSFYVTDLRERQFYKGFRAKKEWHHYQEKHFDYDKPPPNCPWDKKKAQRFDVMNSRTQPQFP